MLPACLRDKQAPCILQQYYSASTGLLTKVRYGGSYDVDYTYDGNGRITKTTDWIDGTDGIRFAFDNAGRLTTITDYDDRTLTYPYDAWGRTLSRVRDGSTTESYAYRYGGRYGGKLYSVTTNYPANSNSTYEYRGDGRLYSRTNGGTTTRFNYGTGFQVLTEEATNGTLQMSYVHDFTTPTGRVLADIAGTDPATGTARYYYHDNIDSTRRLRDANKASLAQYEFDPYGLYYAVSGAETPYKWGPYRLDTSNSMYYTPNRWYVPMQARWLTRDPLAMVDGPNVYTYVTGQPTIHVDPMGASKEPKDGCCKDFEVRLLLWNTRQRYVPMPAPKKVGCSRDDIAGCYVACKALCKRKGMVYHSQQCENERVSSAWLAWLYAEYVPVCTCTCCDKKS